ncbi:hypothetical protein DPMN_039439 [Dreissena polymorpha]|uniref:Uncharacterized protein n=1 Tax=Dreissena polymorpha TaxID=45954 RepID=A0A9D4MH66_DREPO|nr:hypothetical protein DPMN_039439 [Dreissena polymorpha]
MFIAHKNVTERDAVPNTDRMQCASMTKHVVFEHMLVSTKTMLCLLCLTELGNEETFKQRCHDDWMKVEPCSLDFEASQQALKIRLAVKD